MSNELLQKVITSSGLGSTDGAFLNHEQAKNFIDFAWDATTLAKEADRRVMSAPEQSWNTVAVGARITRGAIEAVDTGENAAASFTRLTLRTHKLRLDWELSSDSLEDNIAGGDLDTQLARMFAEQFGQDLEDLAINGDTDSSNPLLKVADGWHKQALQGRVVDASAGNGMGDALGRRHFNAALKALPRKFQARKGDLRFYASPQLCNDYLFAQSEMDANPSDIIVAALGRSSITEGPAGGAIAAPFGVPLMEVPMFDVGFNEANADTDVSALEDNSYLELTAPKNRIWGIQREIQLFREYAVKKDTIEYTMYIRAAWAWQNLDAVVTVDNIPVVQ